MRALIVAVAFGLPGLSPALALDLAKEKAAPISEACPGKPGFVRIPGTRSCTRLSGRVAAGTSLTVGGHVQTPPDLTGRIAIDNRTETDFGEVRTYVRAGHGRW